LKAIKREFGLAAEKKLNQYVKRLTRRISRQKREKWIILTRFSRQI
jgi:hypothetical protein